MGEKSLVETQAHGFSFLVSRKAMDSRNICFHSSFFEPQEIPRFSVKMTPEGGAENGTWGFVRHGFTMIYRSISVQMLFATVVNIVTD